VMTVKYNHEPLENSLKYLFRKRVYDSNGREIIKEKEYDLNSKGMVFNDLGMNIFITSCQDDGTPFHFSPEQCGDLELWEAGRSTSAAPTYFRAHTIHLTDKVMGEKKRFTLTDGGLWSNNPSVLACGYDIHEFIKLVQTIKENILAIVERNFSDRTLEYGEYEGTYRANRFFTLALHSLAKISERVTSELNLPQEFLPDPHQHLTGKQYEDYIACYKKHLELISHHPHLGNIRLLSLGTGQVKSEPISESAGQLAAVRGIINNTMSSQSIGYETGLFTIFPNSYTRINPKITRNGVMVNVELDDTEKSSIDLLKEVAMHEDCRKQLDHFCIDILGLNKKEGVNLSTITELYEYKKTIQTTT